MQIRGVELDFRLYDEDKADVKNRYLWRDFLNFPYFSRLTAS